MSTRAMRMYPMHMCTLACLSAPAPCFVNRSTQTPGSKPDSTGQQAHLHACASGRHRVGSYIPIHYCTILLHIYTDTHRPIDRQTYIRAHMHRAHEEAYLHACMLLHTWKYSASRVGLHDKTHHKEFSGLFLRQLCLLAGASKKAG